MLVRFIQYAPSKESVYVLNLTGEAYFADQLRELGANVLSLDLKSRKLKLTEFFRFLPTGNVNVIGWMYHGSFVASLIWLLCYFRSGLLIWNFRQTLYDLTNEKKNTALVIRMLSAISFLPDHIIFNSKTSLGQHKEFGFHHSNLIFLPNGYDSVERRILHEARYSVVGHVGRVHPMKRSREILKSFIEVARLRPSLEFHLIGSGWYPENPLFSDLMGQVDASRFKFWGEQKEMEKVYTTLGVIVLFSAWGEAFPNVLAESMQFGCIPIATDVGDSGSIIGRDQLMIVKDDLKGLIGKIIEVTDWRASDMSALGGSLSHSIDERFSLSKVSASFWKLNGADA